MKLGPMILHAVIAGSTTATSFAGSAEPREPLIVTQMHDPDPNFVASQGERGVRSYSHSPEPTGLEQVMQSFGRALGQAVAVEQQQIQSRCRQAGGAQLTPEQRFQWAANCRYERH